MKGTLATNSLPTERESVPDFNKGTPLQHQLDTPKRVEAKGKPQHKLYSIPGVTVKDGETNKINLYK